MCDVYRVSSSVKVKQMEAELTRQLSAFRTEMEDSGLSQGAGSTGCCSSVLPPKDVSFFHMEREHALRRGLQVSEAAPVQSQADVMHRELESCLSLEYTAESLPALLHQFYSDRSYHLAHIKYQLLLRWRRFSRHSIVMETLYPQYKDQVSHLTCEYEDAVQRARRLSASRETILTGRGNPGGLLAQDDLLIYLRWLICQLQSVQTVHGFLRVLHYVPVCERTAEEPQAAAESGPDHRVPLHAAQLQDFLPELKALISDFHLPYDAEKLHSSADEMELFSLVWKEFRTIFKRQEQMKTFPQYDGSDAAGSQWGRKSAETALKKQADWIPFIQVKPRLDPRQQKLITKLKEKDAADELLLMDCRFLQVPDLLHVAAALRGRAARVGASTPPSSTSPSSRTETWTKLYSAVRLTQETHSQWCRRKGGGDGRRAPPCSPSFEDSLQALGLEDSLEEGTSDPVVSRGAYLSLVYLRHLKLRELQRVSLGLLNYLRSVERTLTFDLAGLQLEEEELRSTAEETGWMNAARGGGGEAGGLGSLQHVHNTPVDYKVCCSEFMEFAEVENLHDFYSSEWRFVHTQDHRGLYIVYDVALQDLEELKKELLLVGSHFIHRNRIRGKRTTEADVDFWAGTDVDRVAVLLDLWACEAEFLESKVQLLNCYYEAYQHAAGAEQRCALARVITDIMHRRPQLDLDQEYFVQVYRAETSCLQRHQQLIRDVLDTQIQTQRLYLERIWRGDRKPSSQDYGLPLSCAPQHLVSLSGSSPALMKVFLLEVHPSLCLASAVYQGLIRAHAELCQLHRASSVTDRLRLLQQVLQRAQQSWTSLGPPGASYSPQIQKDLFSGVFFEDPLQVQQLGLSLVTSAEETDMKRGQEKQLYAVETFSKLLELVTIRHRLLEAAAETAHLAQLYLNVASELGFGDFHLYLRPLQFEVAEPRGRVQQRPAFMTEILEDDSCVDRFIPSHLPLSIQELDENQIGRFSFSSRQTVTELMDTQSVQNLQVTLACQVTQKNALMSAVKLACLCHWASQRADRDETCDTLQEAASTKERAAEAFVSIQLDKVGLRDEMLHSFLKQKQAVGGIISTSEEAASIKRRLIVDFLRKFCTQTSLHGVRAQIVAYYYSLSVLLDDVPSVHHFMIGRAAEDKDRLDSGCDLRPEPRTVRPRPARLMSADGESLLNLWFIPHFTELLLIFRTLQLQACARALHHTLQVASALHDVVCYLVSFSRLGNREESGSWRRKDEPGSHGAADWGGAEGIGTELQEIQRQVDGLSDPSCPRSVGRLLQLRRQVVLLQFDAAVRSLIREAFLSSGDAAACQSVSDNLATALPLLSDSIQADVFSLALPVPRPLRTRGHQAQRVYPWRSFLACHGPVPLRVWDVAPVEFCMQLCFSGLSDRSRLQANAAILGMSLLMEDVLNSGREAGPVRLHGDEDEDHQHDSRPNKEDHSCTEDEEEETKTVSSDPPIRTQTVLKGFLLLTKQLEVFKESWARRRLGPQVFRTPALYRQFVKLYRAEIFYPSMRALALQMGKERDYEVLVSGSQSLLPPPGASEVDVKAWQLQLLMESSECDMIRQTQRKLNRELTLVVSERTRQDVRLPTELWRKAPLRYSLSPERPQMVETFIQQLMEGAKQQEDGAELRVAQDHLQRCLARLASSVMEQERRLFLLYSQFYEQILQQQNRILYHREQDLRSLKDTQTSKSYKEVADLCREMMLETSGLQARVAHLEEEKRTLEEQLSLKFRERYDPLVRHLFSTCIQLKASLDEYRWQMEQDVSVMVNRIRGEGVDRIIKLKKTYGVTKDNDGLVLTQIKKEEVHELKLENRRLSALLCKMKTLSRWRQAVHQEKLHRQLLQSRQREVSSRTEALRVKMTSEEKVIFLQEELDVAQQLLTRCQADCSSTQRLLSRKAEELQAVRHQSAQELRSRQELDSYRVQSLEQMRVDMEDRERRLRELSEQLDRGSRMSRIQRQRSAKEIQQVRGQLQQERSLKQEAFQQVDKLQNQVNDMGAALPRRNSTTGHSRTYYTLSVSRLSARSPSAGLHRRFGSLTNYGGRHDPERAVTAGNTRADRPKADPPRLLETAEALLPHL